MDEKITFFACIPVIAHLFHRRAAAKTVSFKFVCRSGTLTLKTHPVY
jgi:hypothetical protein